MGTRDGAGELHYTFVKAEALIFSFHLGGFLQLSSG
jgi:hypothetical protein